MRQLASNPAVSDRLNVVLVSFYEPELAKEWMRSISINLPMYIDAKSDTYKMMGYHPRGSIGIKTVFRAVLIGLRRRHLPPPPPGGDIPAQLGGDVIADTSGKILYLYRSVTPDDRPPVRDIVNVLPTLK